MFDILKENMLQNKDNRKEKLKNYFVFDKLYGSPNKKVGVPTMLWNDQKTKNEENKNLIQISFDFDQVCDDCVENVDDVGHERNVAVGATVDEIQRFFDDFLADDFQFGRHVSVKFVGDENASRRLQNANLPEDVEIEIWKLKYF